MKRKVINRLFCYLAGTALIAVGMNFSKLSGLGVTPVSSLPYACERIWGLTLGTTTYVAYVVFLGLQILILRKRFPVRNVFGLLLTFWFSFVIDLLGVDPNAVGHLLIGLPHPAGYGMRILYLLISLAVGAGGVFLYIQTNWIPLPSDGLSIAIATASGKSFGDAKTFCDSAIVLSAVILQLVFLGGLDSFTNGNAIVREGTVIAAVLMGQLVKLYSKWFGARLNRWIGIGEN